MRVCIAGSGLIGRAWATVFASHGFEVALHDVKPEAAKAARTFLGHVRSLAGSMRKIEERILREQFG